MRRSLITLVFSLAVGGILFNFAGECEAFEKKTAGPVRSPDRSSDTSRTRPRLFFTAEKIKRLRSKVKEEGVFREAWLKLKKRADRLLGEELVSKEYADGGAGQHGNYGRPSGQVSNMASTLGLAYQMTGEKRYAEKLRDALVHYGGLKRWAGDAKRDPPWNSELNTARFCFAYAVAYDSIYDFLSEKERKNIARDMIRLGVLPIGYLS